MAGAGGYALIDPTYATERVALFHREALGVIRTLAPGLIDTTLTDPPYSSGGLFRGDRMQSTESKYVNNEHRGHHANFSGDNRDQRSYGYWSTLWMTEVLRATRPGGHLLVFTDWRQLPTTTDAVQAAGWLWRGIIPWDKTEAVRPQLGRFRAQAEYVVWATHGPIDAAGPVLPGVFRHRVDIGEKLHMAAKPVPLLFDLLGLAKGTVADFFMGSGSTGVAALQRGLNFIGCEQDPAHYPTAESELRAAESLGPMFERQVDMLSEGAA